MFCIGGVEFPDGADRDLVRSQCRLNRKQDSFLTGENFHSNETFNANVFLSLNEVPVCILSLTPDM
jgi:hypothetical protein